MLTVLTVSQTICIRPPTIQDMRTEISQPSRETFQWFIAVTQRPDPAGFAPRDISDMARACSFSQVISSRQGGTTTNRDGPLHCQIEK